MGRNTLISVIQDYETINLRESLMHTLMHECHFIYSCTAVMEYLMRNNLIEFNELIRRFSEVMDADMLFSRVINSPMLDHEIQNFVDFTGLPMPSETELKQFAQQMLDKLNDSNYR